MNDTLIRDSLKLANEVLGHSLNAKSTNYWFWIASAEFIIIALLIFKSKTKVKVTERQKFKNESLNNDIDFHNIIDSSFNSTQLYNELKIKCHPDRFPTDKIKNEIAETLFQDISKNKMNIKRLLELKEEAKQKLNINF